MPRSWNQSVVSGRYAVTLKPGLPGRSRRGLGRTVAPVHPTRTGRRRPRRAAHRLTMQLATPTQVEGRRRVLWRCQQSACESTRAPQDKQTRPPALKRETHQSAHGHRASRPSPGQVGLAHRIRKLVLPSHAKRVRRVHQSDKIVYSMRTPARTLPLTVPEIFDLPIRARCRTGIS